MKLMGTVHEHRFYNTEKKISQYGIPGDGLRTIAINLFTKICIIWHLQVNAESAVIMAHDFLLSNVEVPKEQIE